MRSLNTLQSWNDFERKTMLSQVIQTLSKPDLFVDGMNRTVAGFFIVKKINNDESLKIK